MTSQTLCVAKQDYVVLLDENGKAASSEGMAKLVAEVLCSLAYVKLITKRDLVTYTQELEFCMFRQETEEWPT